MNKYIRAVSSNYIFFFVNTIFFLAITPVAIYVMGDELYGVWSILNSILIFSGVGMLGMGDIVNKFASEEHRIAISHSSIISSAIVILFPIALSVMLILLITRNWIAAQFGLDPALQAQFGFAMIFTASSIIPIFLGRIPHGYLLSQLKNTMARFIDTVINILSWTGCVYIAFISKNLVWMTAWVLTIQTVGTIVLFGILILSVRFKWQVQKAVIREMLNFSGFSFLESIAIVLFQQFDRILVGAVLGPSAAGVYSIGTSVGLRITMVIGQATEVMIPYASLKNSQNDHEQLYKTYRQLVRYVGILVALLTGLLVLWIPEILGIWISPAFSENYSFIFRVIIVSYGLFTLCHPGRQTLVGVGKIKFVALIYIFISAFMLLSVYFLSLQFGLMGAALANGAMSTLLIFSLLVYKHLQASNYFLNFLVDIGPGIVIPLIIYIVILWLENSPVKVILSLLIICGFVVFGVVSVSKRFQKSQKIFLNKG